MIEYAIRITEETIPLVMKLNQGVEDLIFYTSTANYLVIELNMRGMVRSAIYPQDEFFAKYRNADKVPVFQILRV